MKFKSNATVIASQTLAQSFSQVFDMAAVDWWSLHLAYSGATPSAKTFTVKTQASGQLTIPAHGYVTGLIGQASNSGGALPTGLSALTNYYVIVIDANTIALATSLANAVAGTPIVLSSNGTGTQTFTPTTSASNVIKLQGGNDGVAANYVDVTTSNFPQINLACTVTVTTSAGVAFWQIGRPPFRYARLLFTPSAGQVTLSASELAKVE